MPFYIFSQPIPGGVRTSVWEVQDNKALRLGVPNAENVKDANCVAKPGQTAIDAICELLNNGETEKWSHWLLPLDPGHYYPRIVRPPDQHIHKFPGSAPGAHKDADAIAVAFGQLNVLTRQLAEICQTVHPTKNTLNTYGHAIRNLLILACTEVESHWRGILEENGIKKKRYSTSDYVQILPAMHLDEYTLTFANYPWLDCRRPFQGWSAGAPTKSLKWYDAYNAVKHDRENNFSLATLGNAFDAVGACAIMMFAQYGYSIPNWLNSYSDRFFSMRGPVWHPSEVYTANYKNIGSVNDVWTPVCYPFKC